jgi:ABC-type transport system involved in cytochrome c biogenesis ATPase subunit
MEYFYGIGCCKIILGDLELREGDTPSAKALLQQSLKSCWGRDNELMSFILERLANRNLWQVVECTFTWPVVYLGHANRSKEKLGVHKALLFLGDVFIVQGNDETANSLFTVALEGFSHMDVHHSRAQCLLRLGDLAKKKGNFIEAQELWTTAHPLFERSSQVKDVAQIDARLAELEDNQKVLVDLATLHPPKTNSAEPVEMQKGEGAGQNSVKDVILSTM